MNSNNKHSFFHQAGFTLIELMVGLTIGMLVSIVIVQVFSVFEAQKRTTTGTADAQTNGSIALFSIGRELQMAGYPLMPVTNSALECTTVTVNGIADTISRLSSVTLVDGGVGSDTVTISYGGTGMGGVPTVITGTGAPTANDVTVSNNFGCNAGDTTLVVNGTSCAISSASAVPAMPASAVTATITLQNVAGVINGANISCLGAWNQIVYRVNNNNLERNGAPSVAGIVNLQAQYGISTAANSNQVTQWVDASGTWAAPAVADRNRIKAIRIAVVARNAKREINDVTAACSSTTATAPTGLCAWEGSTASPAPNIALSNDPDGTRWQRYRYRVFETIIPLRNVIWSKDTL